MQINTKETVRKTLGKYRWDDLKNWQKGLDCLVRHIYHSDDLFVYQKMWADARQVIFETPGYIMYVSAGERQDLMNPNNTKKIPYCSLSVETTLGERNVYRSMIDDTEFCDISGDRERILEFAQNMPSQFFTLDVDKDAQHVSTYWMRAKSQNVYPRHRLIDKERT